MITPSYGLTATERVLPRLALDFTTASLDPRVAIARAGNTATVVNSSGSIVAVNADLPRFDFDPVTLACRGLLIEEARTNALLNSLIDGTDLATQSVTVTATAQTLSFYGTGSVVLSGAASATVDGAGAYPTRTTYTFTPSAGSLTLTVTGTVQFAQLEVGSFATSFIPTAGSAVTRNADVAEMTGTNFSDWYNQSEGTFLVRALRNDNAPRTALALAVDAGSASNYMALGSTNSQCRGRIRASGGSTTSLNSGSSAVGVLRDIVLAYKNTGAAFSSQGFAPSTTGAISVPIVSKLIIGGWSVTPQLNGVVSKVAYWPHRLTNAEVQAFSA